MRNIDEIIIHITDTPKSFKCTIDDIEDWHLARGFSGVGYHYYIDRDGFVWYGRDLERAGAHCKGKNARSVGICFEGGGKDFKPTVEQIEQYRHLQDELFDQLGVLEVSPHNKYSTKTCPNFDIDILKR